MKKLAGALLSLMLLLAGCTSGKDEVSEPDPEVTAAFEEFSRTEYINYLSPSKLNAHYELEDLSAYGLQDMTATMGTIEGDFDFTSTQASLDSLQKIDRSKLSEKDQNLYDRYEAYLKLQLEYDGKTDWYFYFTPNSGLNNNLLTMFTEYVVREEQDIQDVLVYLEESRAYLDSAIEYTRQQAEKGIEQSQATMDSILEQCQRFYDTLGDSEVEKALCDQVDAASYLTDEQKADYKQLIGYQTDQSLMAGYKDVIDYFTERRDLTTSTGCTADSAEGKEYYEVLLKDQTSTSMTPSECKDYLQSFIDDQISLLRMMYAQHGEDYQTDIDYGYTEPEEILDHLREAMQDDFPDGPSVSYTISYLDPSVASDSISAYYLTPPFDDLQNNVIKVNPNTSNELFFDLAHEGFPGHCYQITYELSNTDNPLVRIISNLGYTEGWAKYAEYVALDYTKETNYYTMHMHDIESGIFYQVMSVVDIMVNYEGASADEVDTYLSDLYGEGLGQELYDLAVGDPGLYLPYGVGYAEMYNLRQTAEDKLGNQFDLKEFHQVILDAGTCSFDYLTEQVSSYIKSK